MTLIEETVALLHEVNRDSNLSVRTPSPIECSIEGCVRKKHCKGYCYLHYSRKWRNGDPQAHIPPSWGDAKYRLESRRLINPDTNCWEWTGALIKEGGYGQLSYKGRHGTVHRLAAHVYLGMDLDDERQVCHKCDNRKCFNPDHLFLGTAFDNMRDAVQKGRAVRGERQGRSKLKEADIPKIFAMNKKGMSYSQIAAQFKVVPGTVRKILLRHNWKHVTLSA